MCTTRLKRKKTARTPGSRAFLAVFASYNCQSREICSREGEDDDLESWQRGHEKFFRNEGAEMGYSFSDDLMVVFEDFRVCYQ